MSEGSEQPADDGASGPDDASDGASTRTDASDRRESASKDASDRRGSVPNGESDRRGVHNLVRALDVPKQAKRGFVVGILTAAATYWFFVVASGGSPYSTPYLLSLAAVLAFTAGLLATLVFTVAAAYRLSRRLA